MRSYGTPAGLNQTSPPPIVPCTAHAAAQHDVPCRGKQSHQRLVHRCRARGEPSDGKPPPE